jgi:hypothetical protein
VKSTILQPNKFHIKVTQIKSDVGNALFCYAYIHVASINFTLKRSSYFSETE